MEFRERAKIDVNGLRPKRVHVFLAEKGIGSRRFCEELIKKNLVSINGLVAKLGDKVTLNDKIVYKSQMFIFKDFRDSPNLYLALNKPKNYLCSNYDFKGRSLAISLVQPLFKERLFPIGRLDYKSSGLLLFTNDGKFANGIMHPKGKIDKEYIIESKNGINENLLVNFKLGIRVKGEFFKLKSYKILSENSAKLVLEEGRNREIRKVFLSKNIFLKKVHRVRIGNIKLDDLREGQVRMISLVKVRKLKAKLGVFN